jgi:hypothetical protein
MLDVTKRFTIAIAGAVLGTALFAASAHAGLAAWDQARVTQIAQDLATASDGWWQAMRRQPGAVGDAMDERSMGGKARVLQEMSASLADHLKQGQDRAKTLDQYKSMKEITDDTSDAAQRASLDEPSMDAWAKVADAMRRIAPYYDPEANAGK